MSAPDPLANQRAARNRTRADFNLLLTRARVDLAPAVLKRRAIAEAQRTSLAATQQAVEIANDSRGVVAATAAALVLWLSRKPIAAGATSLLRRFQTRKSPARRAGNRIKLAIDDYWHRLKDYADG